MKFNLYSVKDTKMEVFLSPWVSRNDVAATRQVKDSLSNPDIANSPVGTNPGDFELYCVAEFDDDSGVVVALSAPKLITPIAVLAAGTVLS